MRLAPVFVPVKRIKTPNVSRSEFSDEVIEKLANAILEVQGIVDPIILRRQGSDAYEIVEGVLEYYAAARAREIDLRKGEMVSAFILEGEKEEALKEQVELLRKSRSASTLVSPPISPPVSPPTSVTKNDKNIDKTEEKILPSKPFVISDNSKFESQLLEYHTRLTQIESRFEQRLAKMEQNNKESLKDIQNSLKELELKPAVKSPSLSPLEALNTLDSKKLEQYLKDVRKGEEVIKEREKGHFKSLHDIEKRVKGVGPATVRDIHDRLLVK